MWRSRRLVRRRSSLRVRQPPRRHMHAYSSKAARWCSTRGLQSNAVEVTRGLGQGLRFETIGPKAHLCMRGPADALLVLPSHTEPRQREFEAIVRNWQLLQARRPKARPGGASVGTPAPRAVDGEEGPPSTSAVESREGSGRVQATTRAAEGEGEAKERPPSTDAVESREVSGRAQATTRAAEGEGEAKERPPSTDAVESREVSGRAHAAARAAKGEGEAGRGEGSTAGESAGDDSRRETMAAWLRSREFADALLADPLQGVTVQWVDAGQVDGYPGAPPQQACQTVERKSIPSLTCACLARRWPRATAHAEVSSAPRALLLAVHAPK